MDTWFFCTLGGLESWIRFGFGVKGFSGGRANMSVTWVEVGKGLTLLTSEERIIMYRPVGTLLSAFQKKCASVIRKGEARITRLPPVASSS